MSVTAPIDLDLQHEPVLATDDLAIIEDRADPVTAAISAAAHVHRDPVMLFVYLGILTLIAIIATAGYLAF